MKKTILTLFLSSFFVLSNFIGQTNHTVSTAGMSFSPSSLTINLNDTVTFVCTSGTHNVNGTQTTFPNNPESFGNSLGSGWTFQHVFTISGTYDYQCDPHAGGGMVGSIIVNSPSIFDLTLTGIFDLNIPSSMATVTNGSQGKAIQFTANQNISDLSLYGVGVANNGGGSDGQEYTFPSISVNMGEHVFIARDTVAMNSYFGSCFSIFDHVLLATSSISQNGDDAIELFYNGNVIETFGDINVDGSGQPWEYLDSWAWKDTASANVGNWVFGGVNCSDGSSSMQTSSCPYPLCGGTPPMTYNVTLSVNTSNITVGSAGMYAGGGILGDAMAIQLTDQGSNIWTGIATINAGTTGNYIFLNSPSNAGDWGAKEDLSGLSCSDPNNWNDRILPNITQDTTLLACFGSCETDGTCPTAPPSNQSNVTFKVDMSQVTAGFTTPELNGTFNSWCGNCNAMSDTDGDDIWEISIPLDSGLSIEYKFSADSWSIQEQNDPTASCTNGDTTNTNRVLTVPSNDTILSIVCWGSCDACPTGINQSMNNYISVYPNPSNGFINISSLENLNKVKVRDIYGRVVINKNPSSNKLRLDISHLSTNIYFVECSNKNGVVIHKIIVVD